MATMKEQGSNKTKLTRTNVRQRTPFQDDESSSSGLTRFSICLDEIDAEPFVLEEKESKENTNTNKSDDQQQERHSPEKLEVEKPKQVKRGGLWCHPLNPFKIRTCDLVEREKDPSNRIIHSGIYQGYHLTTNEPVLPHQYKTERKIFRVKRGNKKNTKSARITTRLKASAEEKTMPLNDGDTCVEAAGSESAKSLRKSHSCIHLPPLTPISSEERCTIDSDLLSLKYLSKFSGSVGSKGKYKIPEQSRKKLLGPTVPGVRVHEFLNCPFTYQITSDDEIFDISNSCQFLPSSEDPTCLATVKNNTSEESKYLNILPPINLKMHELHNLLLTNYPLVENFSCL